MPTTRSEQRPEPSDATAARRKLPIGIRTFREVREEGCYYAAKYRGSGRPIHLIGVEFSKETRNLAAFEAAPGDAPTP